MTKEEKKKILNQSFKELWDSVWINEGTNKHYKSEFEYSQKKYNTLNEGFIKNSRLINLGILVNETESINKVLEWGFPKGRRDKNETDIGCAQREFQEETNYVVNDYIHSEDLPIFSEEFIGSNGVAYKYNYYICRSKKKDDCYINPNNKSQIYEIGDIGWFTFEESAQLIQNKRRISILYKINNILLKKYYNELTDQSESSGPLPSFSLSLSSKS